MKKSNPTAVRLWIGKIKIRGSLARDLVHVVGPVAVEEIDIEGEVGGDAVNVADDETQADDAAPALSPIRKVVIHAVTGGLSIASMVAASGIALALGWA